MPHGDCQADLDAKLIGLACFALADAFDPRRVQRVEFVLVLGTLAADSPRPLQPNPQRRLPLVRPLGHLAFDVAQHSAQHGALTLEHATQTFELLGVRVTTGAAAQPLTFTFIGLLERQARAPRQLHQLGPCHP